MRRVPRFLLALLGVFAAGCAAQVPMPVPASPPPSASTASPTIRPASGSTGARVDSLPSQDALAVLGSIPEPLTTAESVDPPARVPSPAPAAPLPSTPVPPVPAPRDSGVPIFAPRSAYDSLRATAEPVPVPVSTRPLGTPPSPDPAPPPVQAPDAAEPDTCWRVQVAAPLEREKAVAMQSAARSLLLVPMVIVPEAGRFKVRSGPCLQRVAAEALRDRAVASGFRGVFLVRDQGPRR